MLRFVKTFSSLHTNVDRFEAAGRLKDIREFPFVSSINRLTSHNIERAYVSDDECRFTACVNNRCVSCEDVPMFLDVLSKQKTCTLIIFCSLTF